MIVIDIAKKKVRSVGGGCNARALKVREALFQGFVDARTRFKTRLPKALFPLQAKKFYVDWLHQHPHKPEQKQLKFSNQWIKGWELEYGVSLRHPNKRYLISKENFSIRVQDYIKPNVKENHHSCRDCVTVFTQIASNENIQLFPEVSTEAHATFKKTLSMG